MLKSLARALKKDIKASRLERKRSKCHGLHITPQNGSIAEIYKELQKHKQKPSKKGYK